jgi:H+-translocating NAD(P) transhydrogenase subunit alpha
MSYFLLSSPPMKIGLLKETAPGERRVGLVPATVKTLIGAGHEIVVEQGAGLEAGFDDAAFQTAGASIGSTADVLQSPLLIKVAPPMASECSTFSKGASLVSLLYPKRHPELLQALAQQGTTCYAMDAMPRITRAQSMDVLSSQNNLAGYKAVVVGANALGSIFPMMTTAAGTVRPAKVLIYGAGVAGLQAIATAKRMGAVVEVTDIRPETKEQVESLGGKFIMVEGLDQVKIEGGYVAGASEDVLARQKEAVEKSLFNADLVVTTALVAGGSAPTLISEDQVKRMKRGAVIVDMATEAGGNCAVSKPDETVTVNGVRIIGCNNLAATVPTHASELYSRNIATFLEEILGETGVSTDTTNELVAATMVVHNGEVRA